MAREEIDRLVEVDRESLEDLHAELEGLVVIALDRGLEARHAFGPLVGRIERRARLHFRIVCCHREAEIETVARIALAVAMDSVPHVAIAAVVGVGLDLETLGLGQMEELVSLGHGVVDRPDRYIVIDGIEEAYVVAGSTNFRGNNFLRHIVAAVERTDVDDRDAGGHRLRRCGKTCCHECLQRSR